MGFHIFGANDGGGGGGELPDYSLTPIIYPRMWINNRPVKEISIFSGIPAYNQASIFLEATPLREFLHPIEGNIFVSDDTLNRWTMWSDWFILKSNSEWFLRVINNTSEFRYFSGTLKYSTSTIFRMVF
jgi:hypothetical protein